MVTETTTFINIKEWNKFSDIRHFISTRNGGCSSVPYTSLNLGFGTEDKAENVLANRKILARDLDIPLQSFVMLNQVHGNEVAVVGRSMMGKGAFDRESAISRTDAMVTNEPGVCLFVMAADCVSLLFFDPNNKVIGAAHAGWRGTVEKIGVRTVKKMNEIYGSKPDDIHVVIGPSIGPCCYEVGSEVINAVRQSFGTTNHFISSGPSEFSSHFDLWDANKAPLLDIGLMEENIVISGLCTQCHSDKFFSSRQGKGITGRFGAGIMLKN